MVYFRIVTLQHRGRREDLATILALPIAVVAVDPSHMREQDTWPAAWKDLVAVWLRTLEALTMDRGQVSAKGLWVAKDTVVIACRRREGRTVDEESRL